MFFVNSKWYFSRKGLTTGQISFLSGSGMIKGVFWEDLLTKMTKSRNHGCPDQIENMDYS